MKELDSDPIIANGSSDDKLCSSTIKEKIDDDKLYICLDIEAYERNHDYLTEFLDGVFSKKNGEIFIKKKSMPLIFLKKPLGLEKCLKKLELPYEKLHNAGNDAYYTMQVFWKLLRDLIFQANNNKNTKSNGNGATNNNTNNVNNNRSNNNNNNNNNNNMNMNGNTNKNDNGGGNFNNKKKYRNLNKYNNNNSYSNHGNNNNNYNNHNNSNNNNNNNYNNHNNNKTSY
ncbi:hypothetical protein BCR32DRAFT_298772 [Anaeromyces robustus]|uniref:Gfd2/YDR514C-like C-terminal domain-containing protein n=1 Tax=Anaeromyces robustus TaxID=1754192 RepID=A0A1Y1UBU9_9FUNG|nr:hypothetical protein BCR32DRAFT_298772 [Anaeromyces robustus]|eukprot:ORX35513.1 hypothetical protein BCR32DRAFT_298772 [Anaeromyces robustus]